MNTTPLRYPGGKSVMTSFIEEIMQVNSMDNVVYAEPYAGGAGAAINLLVSEKVDSIRINDISTGIFSFWYFLLNDSKKFLNKIESIKVDLDEWKNQKRIFINSKFPSIELGVATFFLSRTNRSGILNAGPIGGNTFEKQDQAKYKIDCRFNKVNLLVQLKRIIERKECINVSNYDALTFLNELRGDNILVYLDPPYYKKGRELYYNFYNHSDHLELSNYLKHTNEFKWILSYDNINEIQQLYSDYPLYEFDLTYTAQQIKKGSELFTHSSNIVLPEKPIIKRKSKNIELRSIF